ncbi:MAG: DUF2461 domain-containing protein [Bacteroidales bacterium]|nr:DUF2461 domain-containing protein [Bacteroidales bacterium]
MKNKEYCQINYSSEMKDLYKFLNNLAANNNRDWFMAHKSEYDVLREVFEFMVQELIEAISVFDETIKGVRAKDCLFRIYRDTRFTNDKTPYKKHFGAWITRNGRKGEYPGYYLHIEPGNTLLAAGIWNPDPKLLKLIRKEIFDFIDDLELIINESTFEDTFGHVQGSSLKTLPKGFPKDFERPELLMLKDFFVEKDLSDDFFDENWIEKASSILKTAYPFNKFLTPVVDEFCGVI